MVWIYHILLIRISVDRHLTFSFLAIRCKIIRLYGNCMFNILRYCQTIFQGYCTNFMFLSVIYEDSSFSISLLIIVNLSCFITTLMGVICLVWTWNWANFWRWWGTGRPDVLQSKGSRRVEHDWANEQQWVRSQCDLGSFVTQPL